MPALPSFADLLTPERIVCRMAASTKSDVLETAATVLATDPNVRDPGGLLADLQAREATLSTGVGEGVALPHARTGAVTGTVALLATLATPVEWGAIDGRPVELVVMFAGPEAERSAHVRLLARISRALAGAGIRDRLARACSPDEVLEALAEAEA